MSVDPLPTNAVLVDRLRRATPEQRDQFIESLTPAGRLLVAHALVADEEQRQRTHRVDGPWTSGRM